MGRRRTFDMQEAVDIARQLFWRGYETTSLAELTGAMNIAPASFYHAWGSKEQLFREVVGRYVASQEAAFQRAFQASSTSDGVTALLRGYVEVITDPEHAPGCLVVNNLPSNDPDQALGLWLAAIRKALRLRLEKQFAADLARGKVPAGSQPQVMARHIVTLAGGLAVEARSGAQRHELYAVIDQALSGFPAAPDTPAAPASR